MNDPHPVDNASPVIHSWAIPTTGDGGTLTVGAVAGEILTFVGANGAGKSALATWMCARAPRPLTKRLIAHRKLWFQYAGPEISSAQRAQTTTNMQSWDSSPDSRYLDHADGQRSSIALFDLLGAINDQNGRMVDFYTAGSTVADVEVTVGPRVLDILNQVLLSAGLHIEMRVTQEQTFAARHRALNTDYPIFQMSDGEKSALLLAAEVITATEGCIIIIDEPERHLHRSISAGLVEAVIAARPDCAFVVLTHDLDLAAALSRQAGQTMVVSGCSWSDGAASTWDLHDVPSGSDLPELARQSILGGRKKILFVEGVKGSLDLGLYKTLFPEWQVTPAGGCNSVIRSVTGLHASTSHHWITARGLVDGDGRSDAEITALKSRQILVLPVIEIESYFFCPKVFSAVASKQASTLGIDHLSMTTKATADALSALRLPGTLDRLALKIATETVGRRLAEKIPENVVATDVVLSIPSPYYELVARLESLLQNNDLDALVGEIPVRDTALPQRVATALAFQKTSHYVSAAHTCISESPELLSYIRSDIGEIF